MHIAVKDIFLIFRLKAKNTQEDGIYEPRGMKRVMIMDIHTFNPYSKTAPIGTWSSPLSKNHVVHEPELKTTSLLVTQRQVTSIDLVRNLTRF